jgi:hypothetical protein
MTARSRAGLVAAAAVAVGLAGAASFALAQGTASATSSNAVSWADSQHGWKICPRVALCASDDGGGTWHRVVIPSSFGEVSAVTRTSATAGVIAGGPPQVPIAWTKDRGHTWRFTTRLSGLVTGNAAYLFAHRPPGLVQATPWPPAGNTVQTRVAWRAPAGQFLGGTVSVPGGVAGIVSFQGEPLRLGVLVHRLGSSRVVELPKSNLAGVDFLLRQGLSEHWPDLFVTAQAFVNDAASPGGTRRVSEVFWHSADGGRTWIAGSGR